jgi:hypothetical protein
MRDETDMQTDYPWLETVRARGWQEPLRWLVDTADPIGALVAPLLWIAQPLSRAFGADDVLGDMAHLLDDPAERARLRRWLNDHNAD